MKIVYDKEHVIIGSIDGQETITCEYKEIFLRSLYRFYDNDDLKNLINDENYNINYINFNNVIRLELKHYFLTYLPKYFTNFITSKISGNLHFGITDDGIIEGFPFYGNIEILEKYIEKIHDNALKNVRICCNNSEKKDEIFDWFKDNIKIKITQLDIDENLIDQSYIDRLKAIIAYSEKTTNEWTNYKNAYKKWFDIYMFFCQKIKTLMNDKQVRIDIISYIYKKTKKLDKSEYINAINYYKSDELRTEEITAEIIYKINKDNNDPIKWMVEYKDHKIKTIKNNKPKAPIHMKCDIDYCLYLSRMCNLIPYLYKRNYNFYKIEIIIKYTDQFNDINYAFEYKNNNEWITKRRVVINGNPITVPI